MDLNAIIAPLTDALQVQSLAIHSPAAIPENLRVESLEQFLANPRRSRGELSFGGLESLLAYLHNHHVADSTAIFADSDNLVVRGVLNWHTVDSTEDFPGWGDHVASYKLNHTREFLAWSGISGKPLSQTAFAEFLEENLDAIATPEPVTLLEAVSKLSGKRNTTFEMGRRLENGDTQLEWKEDTVISNGVFPSRFSLNLPVFRGSEAATTFAVQSLLRYRVNEGRLSFEVKLQHLDKIKDMAFERLIASIASEVGKWTVRSTPIYLGSITKKP